MFEISNYYKKISLKIPARLHLDVMNIQKLHEGKVGGGGIGIAIKCNLYISVEVIRAEKDIIESIKPNLVKFYLDLIRKYLNIDKKFYVICKVDKELKAHGGMGSNALVQLGVVYSINYLFNNPLNEAQLIDFLHQNYYEDDNGIVTNKVFCSGVSHNTMLYGGVCFVLEDGEVIYHKELPSDVKVGLINVNLDEIFERENIDKDELIVKLRKQRDIKEGLKDKENIIREIIIKNLKNNKYKAFINEMKMFSKKDDSVALSKNCKINNLKYESFCEIIENIGNTFVRISSNSPYIYIVTNELEKIKEKCSEFGIYIKEYKIANNGIEIIERI